MFMAGIPFLLELVASQLSEWRRLDAGGGPAQAVLPARAAEVVVIDEDSLSDEWLGLQHRCLLAADRAVVHAAGKSGSFRPCQDRAPRCCRGCCDPCSHALALKEAC